jgi:hypothetical protein
MWGQASKIFRLQRLQIKRRGKEDKDDKVIENREHY